MSSHSRDRGSRAHWGPARETPRFATARPGELRVSPTALRSPCVTGALRSAPGPCHRSGRRGRDTCSPDPALPATPRSPWATETREPRRLCRRRRSAPCRDPVEEHPMRPEETPGRPVRKVGRGEAHNDPRKRACLPAKTHLFAPVGGICKKKSVSFVLRRTDAKRQAQARGSHPQPLAGTSVRGTGAEAGGVARVERRLTRV